LRCAVLGIHHVVSFIVCMYHLLKTVCIIRDRGKPLLWMDKIEWREKKNVFLAHCVYETIF
jgi:hypothetical protein